MPSFISGANITGLCKELKDNSSIEPKLYEKYHVKRGLSNSDGTGVVAGITIIEACGHGKVYGLVAEVGAASHKSSLAPSNQSSACHQCHEE